MIGQAVSNSSFNRELAALCSTHGRAFFQSAYGVLRNAQAAEDACQQAFLKACRNPIRETDRFRLKAWLMRVVINESLQIIRRTEVDGRARRRIATGAESWVAKDREDGPADLRETILHAIGELPESTAVVVVLRIMQGMSGNQVKELLGYSAAEVSRRLHTGMDHLRVSLRSLQCEVE